MDPQHVPHQAFAAGWHAALSTTLSLDGDAFQLVHGQPALLAQQAGSLPELADAMPGNMAVVGLDAASRHFVRPAAGVPQAAPEVSASSRRATRCWSRRPTG